MGKSINCLLRETEICARIVQHHWRGVIFERSLKNREYDPSVRARLRSMHLITRMELSHQFQVLREAVGPRGLPSHAVQAYVTILYQLARSRNKNDPITSHRAVLIDQRKVVQSGVLVLLAVLINRYQSRHVIEMVKEIVVEIAQQTEPEKVVDILKSNIIARVAQDMQYCMDNSNINAEHMDASLTSSLNLIAMLTEMVNKANAPNEEDRSSSKSMGDSAAERSYILDRLKKSFFQFLATESIVHTLCSVLRANRSKSAVSSSILNTLRLMATSFAFPLVLDAMTKHGGRVLEQIILCLEEDNPAIVSAAAAFYYEMTSQVDARNGFTTAGAVQIFMRRCTMGIEHTKDPMSFSMSLIGIALLARQGKSTRPLPRYSSLALMLGSLSSVSGRINAFYNVLLDTVTDEWSPRAAEKAAVFLLASNAMPVLLRFMTQVSPSCMDSPHQTSRQRNISCIVLGRFFKVANVAQQCFSEVLVNHLALSIQCNRLDEMEGATSRFGFQDRSIHQMGYKDACKALSYLARCPSSQVNAKLRPSMTSASVPELPQALVCDVVVRLHVLEDLISLIRRPNDAAESVSLDLAVIRAAIELTGYLRPMPFGQSARERFARDMAGHPHGKYAVARLHQLVDLVAPAILHVLRDEQCCSVLVETCCSALSRLASTNAACSTLLAQGSLHTALLHLPVVFVQPRKALQDQTTYAFDSMVDDHGILDVPASLFTLVGKLCAIADGRIAVMKAQVLPRILRRLQLQNATNKHIDDDCKSEIADAIRQLAMVNAVEGNTSELFLHFNVLELLVSFLRGHADHQPVKIKDKLRRWRLLDHIVGAISALSQDIMVVVPKLVQLNVLKIIMPFLVRTKEFDMSAHIESLQYNVVMISHAVASYPLGEFHAHLLSVKGKPLSTSEAAEAVGFMDRIKKIGYDFALEVQNRSSHAQDRSTIGELARSILALVNERQHRQQSSPAVVKTPTSVARSSLPKPGKFPGPAPFPALCSSPLKGEGETPQIEPPSCHTPTTSSRSLAPVASPKRSWTPPEIRDDADSGIVCIDLASNSKICVNGVNLNDTRPTRRNEIPATHDGTTAQDAQQAPHYTFARPKPTKKKRSDALYSLMLDPLFPSSMPAQQNVLPQHPRRSQSDRCPIEPSEDSVADSGYSYSHELHRFGHCVNVKGQRQRKGGKYVRSIGRIDVKS